MRLEHFVAAITALGAAGCTTTNINASQPHLQSINLGHPSCVIDCQTTQTATQAIGDGDVQGASVSNQKSQQRSLGGSQ
jgi:hypothetical protein